MKPAILVTGISGFIGKAFTDRAGDEYDIFAIDRVKPAGWPDERFLECDISAPNAEIIIAESLRGRHFAAAVHFAAVTPHSSAGNPLDFYRVNTLGTRQFLQGITGSVDKTAVISTVDVYGEPENTVIDENTRCEPENDYAVSKLSAELAARAWSRFTGIPAAVIRLGQVYGPGDLSKKAIPGFCRAVAHNQPIIIRGTGQDTRQPIYIQDILLGILAWVHKNDSPAFARYLLAGRENVTILAIAEMVAGLDAGFTAGIRFESAVKPETRQQFDNSLSRRSLNWQPEIPLSKGLQETLRIMKHGG
jgi:nucleoside-diphosphate-sugar epimerase